MNSGAVAGTVRRLAGAVREFACGRSNRAMAIVVFFLAVPQVYLLPRGTVDIALTTILTALFLPGVLLAANRRPPSALLRAGLFRVLLAVLALRIVALAWSPDPRAGLAPIVLLGQFIATLVMVAEAVRSDPGLLRRLGLMYWPLVVAEAALVVLFRLWPGVEDTFLHGISGVFFGQNARTSLFGPSENNVFDPAKAGGVFVNANVAALFLGVNGMAALAVSSITKGRWVRVVGIAALVAVPFTGSKSATVMAIVLPTIAFGICRVSTSRTWTVRRYLLPALAASVSIGVAVLLLGASRIGIVRAMVRSFEERTAIWGFGAQAFRKHPVLGLGYGGWDIGFASYARDHGVGRTYPPHNVLIAAWSMTGIAGVVLSVAFFALTFWLFFRGLSERTDDAKRFAAWAGPAVGWVLIHGMGDNTDIFGEIHLIPIFALLIACVVQQAGEENDKYGRHTYRRHRAAPAIPTV